MILKELRITLMTYGPDNGKRVGEITFSGDPGKITLRLNSDHLDEIFRVCADSLIDTARAAARHMVCRVIEQKDESTKALERRYGH